jgi:hypothetical protein
MQAESPEKNQPTPLNTVISQETTDQFHRKTQVLKKKIGILLIYILAEH